MGDLAEYMTDNYMPKVEKKKSKRRKPKPKKTTSKLIIVSLKMMPGEHRALKAQAKKYAQGNFSAWCRHAGLRYRPKRGEVVKTVTMPGAKKKR